MKSSISVGGGIVAIGTASLRGQPPLASLLASQGIPKQGRVFLTSAQIDDLVGLLHDAQRELSAMPLVGEAYDGLPEQVCSFISSDSARGYAVFESVHAGHEVALHLRKDGTSLVLSVANDPLYRNELEAAFDAIEGYLPPPYSAVEVEHFDLPRLDAWLERRGYLRAGSRMRKGVGERDLSLAVEE